MRTFNPSIKSWESVRELRNREWGCERRRQTTQVILTDQSLQKSQPPSTKRLLWGHLEGFLSSTWGVQGSILWWGELSIEFRGCWIRERVGCVLWCSKSKHQIWNSPIPLVRSSHMFWSEGRGTRKFRHSTCSVYVSVMSLLLRRNNLTKNEKGCVWVYSLSLQERCGGRSVRLAWGK